MDMKSKLIIFGFCLYVLVLSAAVDCKGLQQITEANNVNKPLPDSNSVITKKYIDIGDAYFYYEIAGKGVPVILIHGHSVDCRMWDAQFTELAKRYKVVRYDMRGYGRTDMPVEGQKFLHAEDLHELMWFLGIPKAHLVGLSMGSSVAVDFMALYPEQTLSLTVAAGGIRKSTVPEDANASQKARIEAEERRKKLDSIEAVKKQGIEAYKKQWLEFVLSVCGPHKSRIQPKLQQMINDWSAWQALHVEPPWELDPPVTMQLKAQKPDIPVLVMVGKYDSPNTISSQEALMDILPNARRYDFADAGHFPNMESLEEFNKALTEFLASTGKAKNK
jgi:pimeloyl-ACP methyl ester carboxylesterase